MEKKDTESQSERNFIYAADLYTDKVVSGLWFCILSFLIYVHGMLCPITLQQGECIVIAFIPILFLTNVGFKRHW